MLGKLTIQPVTGGFTPPHAARHPSRGLPFGP